MKILFVASENSPYAQVGGLSQVISFLSRALRKQGEDVRIFMPLYGKVNIRKYPLKTVLEKLAVPTGHKQGVHESQLICNIKTQLHTGIFAPAYFLENREYFELRANAYGYADEHVRFYLLSMGCLEWLLDNAKTGGFVPDIIHAHDWHTGYLVEQIKRNPRYKKALGKIKVLYTVHNFLYQGNHDFRFEEHPDQGKSQLLPAFDPKMQFQNPLLRGILHADHVNTVSRKHALEVQTKEFGEGLQKVLKKISPKLSGMANGIDTVEMDPLTDKKIKFHYSASRPKNRKPNKAVLQRLYGLPVRDDLPLIAYIGRYAAQKGIELILRSLEHIEELPPAQYIFLGGGDAVYCNELNTLAKKYPDQVAVKLHLDFVLVRKLFAGSDIVLIPSKFEPGGIVAMEALRYGAIPVASDTGGLSETVIPYVPKTSIGNGFLHDRKSLWSFYGQLVTAIGLYQIPSVWNKIIQNGMRSDFSWDNTAKKYKTLYQTLLKR